ncbi:MAG: hypothetical protein GC183_07245 [Thiobacillus sp.]|nr:hypothetical protein [Thiobacillus sp.]
MQILHQSVRPAHSFVKLLLLGPGDVGGFHPEARGGFRVLFALAAPIQKLFSLLLIQNTMPQFCTTWTPPLQTASNFTVANQ